MGGPAFTVARAGDTMRALLNGAVDYAGLFPPAALDMAAAVSNFATYRSSADAWALGRFVVSAARLDEFAQAATPHWPAAVASHGAWPLSVLVGSDVVTDAARIASFNGSYRGYAVVDCIETSASDAEAIRKLAMRFSAQELYIEVPLDASLAALLSVIRECGAMAKVRTGGIVAHVIPSAAAVARFIRACAEAGVAFKATAGLHHPLRGDYPLTYAPGSARATMFGYVNVFVAALRAHEGAPENELVAVLEASDFAALSRAAGRTTEATYDVLCGLPADAMRATRATFARSFGSCSFREPLDDLAALLQR